MIQLLLDCKLLLDYKLFFIPTRKCKIAHTINVYYIVHSVNIFY